MDGLDMEFDFEIRGSGSMPNIGGVIFAFEGLDLYFTTVGVITSENTHSVGDNMG